MRLNLWFIPYVTNRRNYIDHSPTSRVIWILFFWIKLWWTALSWSYTFIERKRIKMFPSRVRYILTVFDAFGYNSGSTTLSSHRRTANLICILHILLALYFTCFTFYLKMRLSSFTRWVELLNHLLNYSSTIYMYWFTIWDAFRHWREHHRFWTIFRKINDSFQSQRNFTYRTFTLKFVLIILTTTVSVLISQLTTETYHEMTEIIVVNVTLVKLCQIRIFYYLFCLEAINFQLKSIVIALREMCERESFPSDGGDVHRFKRIQQYYHCVYEMAYLSNDIFNWSQVAAVSFCFYAILTDLNWFSVNFSALASGQLIGKNMFQCNS